jgi:diaminohydroxyphosphoribosylaminopyrimidine deaminase/5-amino-6-(5-phosphoribosylamino)uracil reductase
VPLSFDLSPNPYSFFFCSQWITGEKAREDSHLLRAESQAIIVGARTALLDRPRLNVRRKEEEGVPVSPLRVVVDSSGTSTPSKDHPLLDLALGPTVIFTTEKSRGSDSRKRWEDHGVEVIETKVTVEEGEEGRRGGGVDLESVLQNLGKRGILQVMVEGGASLHASFLNKGLIQKLVVYQGAYILGGKNTLCWPPTDLSLLDGDTITKAKPWTLQSVQRFDNDVRMVYKL